MQKKHIKIIIVAGARPNFMKIAPIIKEIKKTNNISYMLVHTGQHYDKNMSETFFKDLSIPSPDFNLCVGSGTHARQTAEIMVRFEDVLLNNKPDLVMVVGDVNSTLGCSIVASKMRIPVAHVEAGLRSFDMSMPEEINRIVTDRISDILFTTCEDANFNLMKEGVDRKNIYFVGNVMIDTLMNFASEAKKSSIHRRLNLSNKKYALVTLHRPSNVDEIESINQILSALQEIQKYTTVVFPIHPRTRQKLAKNKIYKKNIKSSMIFTEPLSYLDFLCLMMRSAFVITDSGGIQEETTVLSIPCLTVRNNTERPVTITCGTNTLVGTSKRKIVAEARKILNNEYNKCGKPMLWDGSSAKRIIKILSRIDYSRFYKR